MKRGEYLEQLNNYQIYVKKDFTAGRYLVD
jgi:hypothetical protein